MIFRMMQHDGFAVLTKVKQRKPVCNNPDQRGCTNYIPLQKVTRIYTRKRRTTLLPLIYRYIFVHIIKDEYVKGCQTQCRRFCKIQQSKSFSIPDHEIEWLQRVTGEINDISIENKP